MFNDNKFTNIIPSYTYIYFYDDLGNNSFSTQLHDAHYKMFWDLLFPLESCQWQPYSKSYSYLVSNHGWLPSISTWLNRLQHLHSHIYACIRPPKSASSFENKAKCTTTKQASSLDIVWTNKMPFTKIQKDLNKEYKWNKLMTLTSSVFLYKLKGPQLPKIYFTSMEPRVHYNDQSSPMSDPVLGKACKNRHITLTFHLFRKCHPRYCNEWKVL